jgi:hypothetical protein
MSTEDLYRVVRSGNPDVERAQLNKILARLAELAAQGGSGGTSLDIDGGDAFTTFSETSPVIDGGGA